MKKLILSIVYSLFIAFNDEIEIVWNELTDRKNLKILNNYLEELENEYIIYKIFPEENSENKLGYILGNSEPYEDYSVSKIIIEKGFTRRDHSIVKWDLFSQRIIKDLENDINFLKEDLIKHYEDPKKLELRYFDLSIKYHSLYRFLFENHDAEGLKPIKVKLDKLRQQLNKLEY